jgi:predicted transposase/invertase (TIGR01784 family)
LNLLLKVREKTILEIIMETSDQNPIQYEWGPFPFGDGEHILDIRYDPVFKAVFTKDTSASRGALSNLISALIGCNVAVETIIANEPPIDDLRQRYVRFDVVCKTEKSELVNVEMSFNPGSDEQVRLEYYVARLFVGQNLHGKDKKFNDLKETYQITILAKEKFFPDKNLTHNFLYYDPDTRVSLDGRTRIITVELVKTKPIVEKLVEEMTNAELWAVFFQYLTDEKKRDKIIEIIKHEEGIAMAVETLGTFTQEEIDYIHQTRLIMGELDWNSRMADAENKGRSEGRNEGLIEGQNKASLDIARNLKGMGLSISQIAEGTGLSPEIIAQL